MQVAQAINLLSTKSLTGLACEEIEKWIYSGRIQPGEPLREAEISARIGLSRGPVREAFRMLQERGLVLCEKNRGVRVRSLSFKEVQEIYELRVSLEGLIGRLAAQRRTSDEAGRLQKIIEQMHAEVEKGNVLRYAELNFELHEELAKSAGNAVLADTYSRLVVQLKLFRSYSLRHNADNVRQSLLEHAAIVEAVAAGDASRAQSLLQEHCCASLERIRVQMPEFAASQTQESSALKA